jgi:hypothetical protein
MSRYRLFVIVVFLVLLLAALVWTFHSAIFPTSAEQTAT